MFDDHLMHIGVKRRSGRYPWGSGKDPYQHSLMFIDYMKECKILGMNEKDIADSLGLKVVQLRQEVSVARTTKRAQDVSRALTLKEKGYSNNAAAKMMGIPESTFRNLLKPAIQERADIINTTADVLKKRADKIKYLDISYGIEAQVGVSRHKLLTAASLLEAEGYKIHKIDTLQVLTNKKTKTLVLTPPDIEFSEVSRNRHLIKNLEDYSEDGGRTFLGLEPPKPISSDRVLIRYSEDGGIDKDGLIEIRRGVPELDLGKSTYAQVRINVDDTHYMKGMAVHTDDIPKGYDVVFNTNKTKDIPKMEVFKPMKDDKDNPFQTTVRQKHYVDPKTGKLELSALNIVGTGEKSNEEGNWAKWSNSLSSQFLSKQRDTLIKKQLKQTYDEKLEEYNEIMKYQNGSVKRKLLLTFSDECDAAASHLEAAALPRQQNHVIIPIPSMKDTEVYAPNYRNGEKVVLVRHPHGGIFEIPELTVNNKHPKAKKILGNARDAIGINKSVADRLSGADFDGDHVMVIPNNDGKIVRRKPLEGLKDFDPKIKYATTKEERESGKVKLMTKKMEGYEMGSVSNLITDMTIKKATIPEIERAVRHSMVVIDSEKHKLNYMQSYMDNGIAQLKEKYQGGKNRGASTLISRASSEKRILEEKPISIENPKINPKTGEYIRELTGRTYVDKHGNTVAAVQKTTRMQLVKDARELSSGTVTEGIYAGHANDLKALANKARLSYLNTPPQKYIPGAKEIYRSEVESLDNKLSNVLKNKPRERQAQALARYIVNTKIQDNPGLTKEQKKKISTQAIVEARSRTGAKRYSIEITQKEWDAIQSGAISNSKLNKILSNTDIEVVKEYAMPREKRLMTDVKIARAKSMKEAGYNRREIADALGVSISTLDKSIQ